MRKFAKELITGLKQAAAHAKDRRVRGMRVTTDKVKVIARVSDLSAVARRAKAEATRGGE
jgi:hypothetical protein